MLIKRVIVGPLETNCYILERDETCLIIDPGDEFEKIKNNISKKVIGVVITHFHDDHIGALDEILEYYKIRCYSIKNMKEGLNNIDDFSFEVIYTPGHKEDAITLYFKEESVMFTGDFIFYNSIGRTDFEGGSNIEMKKSIKHILEYPKDILVYPGHGPETSLNEEERTLSYFFNII